MKTLITAAKLALIVLFINLVTSAAFAQATASDATGTKVSDLERQINEQTKNIESHPNEAWPYANRARLYERLGNVDEAFKDLARAIETTPGDEWQYRNRADAYNRRGNFDAARADYTRAIELNPNFASAYYDRALTFLKQGKKAEAIEELIVSAQIDLTERNQDVAPVAFEKVIELDPKDFRGHRGLGYTKLFELTQWPDYDVAIESFNKALSLMPTDVDSLTWRGTAYLRWEKYAPAVVDLTKAIQLKPSAELYTLRAEAYEKLGKAVLSAADKKKASTLSPDRAMERAAAARRSGNMELAIQEYTKAIQLGSTKAYRERGKTYMRMGKDDLALADFKEGRIENNEDFDIELGRGEIYTRRGDYERALSAYERVALKSNDETVKKFAREKSAEALANVKAQRK